MDIKKKFELGESNHTYQRIDNAYKVNIFLGYNDYGQMSMVITEPGREVVVKSSNYIDVKLRRRNDGKMALAFELLDGTYKSLFILFCKDIISVCELVGSDKAISKAISRWKYWKDMFGKKKQRILGESNIKGLIGELIELKDHIMKKWGETKAISSWMGPLGGHRDFEIDDTWFEVKTINDGANQVSITSLEQLDSNNNGYLVVTRLEITSPTNRDAINLNNIISAIFNIIIDPDNRILFWNRLDEIGYVWAEEYNDYCYIYKDTQYYYVTDNFPKLKRSDINTSIGNVSYSILLDGIKEFKKDKQNDT